MYGKVWGVTDEALAAARALSEGGLIVVAQEAAARGFFLGVAALATAETVNTALLWGRGLTCFSVTAERAMALGLLLGGELGDGHRGPVFLRSVEAATCEGTGISAADRAETLRAAGAPDAGMGSLKSPGHVMPVLAGFKGEHGATAEAALNLVRRLTGYEVAAWTLILDDDGELASPARCRARALELGLVCLELDDVLVEA
jgi:3,4-dihydroxy 2-butanone 4-phosphate synthase/GTP cyclohydrolase II